MFIWVKLGRTSNRGPGRVISGKYPIQSVLISFQQAPMAILNEGSNCPQHMILKTRGGDTTTCKISKWGKAHAYLGETG